MEIDNSIVEVTSKITLTREQVTKIISDYLVNRGYGVKSLRYNTTLDTHLGNINIHIQTLGSVEIDLSNDVDKFNYTK